MRQLPILLSLATLAGCAGETSLSECRPWNESPASVDQDGIRSRLPGRWVQCGGLKLSNFSGVQFEENGRWVLLQRLDPGGLTPDFTRTGVLDLEEVGGGVRIHMVSDEWGPWMTLSLTETNRLALQDLPDGFHAGMERAPDPDESPAGLSEGGFHGEGG